MRDVLTISFPSLFRWSIPLLLGLTYLNRCGAVPVASDLMEYGGAGAGGLDYLDDDVIIDDTALERGYPLDKRAWNSNFSGGLGKRAWASNFSGGMGKRAWNNNFSGGIGKRAWASNFGGGMGKRAWNNNFSGGLGKRAWASNFSGGLGKRAWNSGFSGGLGKRSADYAEGDEKEKRGWTDQARGTWGKRSGGVSRPPPEEVGEEEDVLINPEAGPEDNYNLSILRRKRSPSSVYKWLQQGLKVSGNKRTKAAWLQLRGMWGKRSGGSQIHQNTNTVMKLKGLGPVRKIPFIAR